MRDKIADYLKRTGHPVPAEQILREVMNIRSPNSLAADKVLRGILGRDPHFRRSQGCWHLASLPAPQPADSAALFIEQDAQRHCFRGAIHLPASESTWEFLISENRSASEIRGLRAGRLKAQGRLLVAWSAREIRLWKSLLRTWNLPEWHGESLDLDRLAGKIFPDAAPYRHAQARTSHQVSTAAADPGQSITVRSVGLPDVPSSTPAEPSGRAPCTHTRLRRLATDPAEKNGLELAPILGLAVPDTDKPAAMARYVSLSFGSLLERVPAQHRDAIAALERWIGEGSPRVDFARFSFGREFLASLPESPGVYLMKNRSGEVIYVGKAGNLRRRVRSYFRPRALRDPKIARIHSQLYSLDFSTCATEIEALLLELQLIRDLHPAINLQSEVHEQQQRYGRGRNLLLLVPSGENAEVYFLQEGSFVARHSTPLGAGHPKCIRTQIRTTFFRARRPKLPARDEWETEIVARWLSAHRKHFNFIDVDEAGSCESVLRRLEAYLRDPDRLAHKVFYR